MTATSFPMQSSFRSAVVTSRTAAVAIALLTTWAIVNLVYALEGPAQHLLILIGTAIAIHDIPAHSSTSEVRMALLLSSQSLLSALTEFGMAWIVSKAIYGAGPLTALRRAHKELKDTPNA
jgi:hypothetical protein